MKARTPGLFLLALCGASLKGQAIRTAIAPPIAVLTHDFGRIASVRELPDGRVIVTDGIENRVLVADFRSQLVEQVGRQGGGPGEFRNAGLAMGLAGDT